MYFVLCYAYAGLSAQFCQSLVQRKSISRRTCHLKMKVLKSLVLITFLFERSPVTAQSTTINLQELSPSENKESLCNTECQKLIKNETFYQILELRNTTICQDLKDICSQEGFQGCQFTWEEDFYYKRESENHALRLKIENCHVCNRSNQCELN